MVQSPTQSDDGAMFLADGRKIRFDFTGPELVDHAADRNMLSRKIFWSKHLGGERIFKEKSRASCLAGNFC